MTDFVWPSVRVASSLERARIEWIHGNGAGAYASSTVAQMNTRRYHGHLVAASTPPTGRIVLLANVDAFVQGDGAPIGVSADEIVASNGVIVIKTKRGNVLATTVGPRYRRVLPPDTLQKAEALYRTRLAMLVVGSIYGFAMLVGILFWRVAPRFRRPSARSVAWWVGCLPMGLLTSVILTFFSAILVLPRSACGNRIALKKLVQ